MAIQTVNLAVPNGDTPRSANTKINANFSDPTHAASRLVGTNAGNVMEVGAFGLGGFQNASRSESESTATGLIDKLLTKGSGFFRNNSVNTLSPTYAAGVFSNSVDTFMGISAAYSTNEVRVFSGIDTDKANPRIMTLWHDKNATKDSNGFLKGASPVIDMYDNKMDLNEDAQKQGGITFEKLGVGDYLVKGSLGFAQEGWYIETPKDANGNVLVAVVYEQLANNDLSIKTYAKRFDDETGDIVPNLLKPRDIPVGRFISLRLHELPKESPVMPMEV